MTKVLVSFNDRLLKRIDRAANAGGKTRSAFLAEIAESALLQGGGPGQQRSSRKAMKELDRLFAQAPSEDSTAAIREERDAR